jgi:hypothetical protein
MAGLVLSLWCICQRHLLHLLRLWESKDWQKASGKMYSARPFATPSLNPQNWPYYPNRTNTGVPPGTVLTTYAGPTNITVNNTVIDSQICNLALTINASGVTIKNSIVFCDTNSFFALFSQTNAFNVLNCEVIGPYVTGTTCISSDFGGTFDHVIIRGSENGFVAGGSGTISNCYLYDIQNDANAHPDGIAFQGGQNGWSVIHNRVEACGNAGIYINNDFGSVNNIICDDNLVIQKQNDGANFAMFIDQKAAHPSNLITNITQTNNVLQIGFLNYRTDNIGAQLTVHGNRDAFTYVYAGN